MAPKFFAELKGKSGILEAEREARYADTILIGVWATIKSQSSAAKGLKVNAIMPLP